MKVTIYVNSEKITVMLNNTLTLRILCGSAPHSLIEVRF